jgi:hypothetical protein
MGFMDRFKGAASTAGAAMRMPTQTDMAYAQRAQRLHQVGVEVPATLTAVEPTGRTDVGGGSEYRFDVTVSPPDGASYAGSFTQYMLAGQMGAWAQPGGAVRVKMDPEDPSALMMIGGA